MTALVLFWVSLAVLLHTYLLYPVFLSLWGKRRKPNQDVYTSVEDLPGVSVLMAVHNELPVLEKKIESIIANHIPDAKLEILIGSDASDDGTNDLLIQISGRYQFLHAVFFDKRTGKSAIINHLAGIASHDILVLTDANVILDSATLSGLLRHFKNSRIGLVDSYMKNTGIIKTGISIQESSYITLEARVKYLEGLIWGTMMGPSGGCYAVRKYLYRDVPSGFLVDDFFISMNVLASGKKAILEPDALVYEDVSNRLTEEFRRKIRIAAGNFQNLVHFRKFLFSSVKGLSFSYISHKVLRWTGPLFMLTIFISTLILSRSNIWFGYLFKVQMILLASPLIDFLLGKIKIHVLILRFITHFICMNLALVAGFLKYLKGVKTNVWQPTRRNQT